MAFDFAPLVAAADALIGNFGQPASLSRIDTQDYDPVTGKATVSETISPATIVFVSGSSPFTQSLVGGDSVASNALFCLVSAVGLAFAPKPGDRVRWGAGNDMPVDAIKEINPAGTVVVYGMAIGN